MGTNEFAGHSTIILTGTLFKEGKLFDLKPNSNGIIGKGYRNVLEITSRVDTRRTNQDTGETYDTKVKTFMPFIIRGNRAEPFSTMYNKGDVVHLTGELMPRLVEREDGTQYTSFELKVDGELRQNQARRIHQQAFEMSNPEYVKQREAERQGQAAPREQRDSNGDEYSFDDYDQDSAEMDM